MAITNFIPEVWSGSLLTQLEKSLVYGSPAVVNRNYEGEISAFGDTVHITNLGSPTIKSYNRNSNLDAPETLSDADQLLVIDQAEAYHWQFDDLDALQARNGGAVFNEAISRSAYALRDKSDQFLAGRMASAAGKGLGIVDASSTASNVYDQLLVPASVALDKANVPEESRFIVLSPDAYGKLRLDARFIKANESGTNALHNGNVGEAAGFTIFKSNNAPTSAARTGLTITTSTTTGATKTITAAAGTFSGADMGLALTGTGVGSAAVIDSVSADGGAVTVTVASTAAATITDGAVAAGASPLIIAGSNIATSYAQQLLKSEAYRPELRFADAVKGIHVYGAKVIRREALVVAQLKTA